MGSDIEGLLDLRAGVARDRMLSFLDALTIGSEDEGVRTKVHGLMAHVVHAPQP